MRPPEPDQRGAARPEGDGKDRSGREEVPLPAAEPPARLGSVHPPVTLTNFRAAGPPGADANEAVARAISTTGALMPELDPIM